jgi:diguanylate cyclase (GGDEF)-like protein/PAS domain S-box-containing protein
MYFHLKEAIIPPLPKDLPDSHRGEILRNILLITMLVSLLSGLVIASTVGMPNVAWRILICTDILVVLCLLPLHYGRVKLAALQLALSIWLVISYLALYFHGGLDSPTLPIYIIIIFMVGLLAGERYAYVFAGLSCISVVLLYFLQIAGALPAASELISVERRLIFQVIALTLAALFLSVAKQAIQISEERAQRTENQLKQKNLELEEIRTNLEDRIARRTREITTQEQYYEALVHNTPLAVVSLDNQHKIISINPAFESLFGYNSQQAIGRDLDDLITNQSNRAEAASYTYQVLRGEAINRTARRQRANGSPVDVEIFGVPVMVSQEQIGILALYHDITERMSAEEQLRYLATHDMLTRIPNRSLFYDRLGHALELTRRNNHQMGVLFLDLDGFKNINDTFGHIRGDQVLEMVAARLKTTIRRSDTVARFGGDEFSIILERIRSSGDATTVANKILEAISRPFLIEHREVKLHASIGISISPEDGFDPEILLKKADAAMYRAKQLGKNNYQFFDQVTNRVSAKARLSLPKSA